jgi:hypothetical protein
MEANLECVKHSSAADAGADSLQLGANPARGIDAALHDAGLELVGQGDGFALPHIDDLERRDRTSKSDFS